MDDVSEIDRGVRQACLAQQRQRIVILLRSRRVAATADGEPSRWANQAGRTRLNCDHRKKCESFTCVVLAIGGMPDHVHLPVRMPATIAPADLIQEVNGSSSHAMNHQNAPAQHFGWQGGYGMFSVSVNVLEAVSAYIRAQKQRHADSSLDVRLETTHSG